MRSKHHYKPLNLYEFSTLTGILSENVDSTKNGREAGAWGRQSLETYCDTPGVFYEINLPRRQEVIVNRLRCGHTSLTHLCLMNSDVREAAPGCPVCQDATLTVRHLLLECRELQLIWQQCFSVYKRLNHVNIVNVLDNDCKIDELALF